MAIPRLQHGTASASIVAALPASQNTAPVAEFRCLFTNDIRRKQKRWHDGYLKFHTFNNRVMAYDSSRNYLGDTYWKESNALQEGDELTLDKGVMIEVADAMGVTQTDLTPLFEKKSRESPQRQKNPVLPTRPLQRTTGLPATGPRAASQLRHKSLNTLLGTPKGPIGKAVPIISPYEARKEQENEWAESAVKRQKTNHNHQPMRAPSLVREERIATIQAPLPHVNRAHEPRNTRVAVVPVSRSVNIVSVDTESDTFSSDITLPMTSPTMPRAKSTTQSISALTVNSVPAKPSVLPSRIPKGKIPLPPSKPKETPKKAPPTSSPLVSTSNRIKNIDFAIPPSVHSQENLSPIQSPPRNPKAKSLRLSKGSRRVMLFCQAPPPQESRRADELRSLSRKAREKKAIELSREEAITGFPGDDAFSLERIAVRTDASLPTTKGKRKTSPAVAKGDNKEQMTEVPSPQPSVDEFGDMEAIEGLIDQPLLVDSSPLQPPDSPLSASLEDLRAPSPQIDDAQKCAIKDSLSPGPMQLNARSSKASDPPPKVALSTGGLGKKATRARKTATNARDRAADNHPIVAALPPHSLRANKSNTSMTTSELSFTLQKPRKQPSLEDDPIEDSSQLSAPPPQNRNFRRARSTNDAPIPSASEEWEKRNMSTTTGNAVAAAAASVEAPNAVFKVPPKKSAGGNGLAALVKKTDPRHKFQRTRSLVVDTSVGGMSMLPGNGEESASPSPDDDVGPWSTEAFDLFAWRPPVKDG